MTSRFVSFNLLYLQNETPIDRSSYFRILIPHLGPQKLWFGDTWLNKYSRQKLLSSLQHVRKLVYLTRFLQNLKRGVWKFSDTLYYIPLVCQQVTAWHHVTVEAGCHTCVYGLGLGQGLLRAACGFCASAMGCTPSTHKKRGSRDDQSSHAHQLINNSGNISSQFCYVMYTVFRSLYSWPLIRGLFFK